MVDIHYQGEALKHTSVGQRPTLRWCVMSRLKALNIPTQRQDAVATLRARPTALEFLHTSRRALPYADMHKAFGLEMSTIL